MHADVAIKARLRTVSSDIKLPIHILEQNKVRVCLLMNEFLELQS